MAVEGHSRGWKSLESKHYCWEGIRGETEQLDDAKNTEDTACTNTQRVSITWTRPWSEANKRDTNLFASYCSEFSSTTKAPLQTSFPVSVVAETLLLETQNHEVWQRRTQPWQTPTPRSCSELFQLLSAWWKDIVSSFLDNKLGCSHIRRRLKMARVEKWWRMWQEIEDDCAKDAYSPKRRVQLFTWVASVETIVNQVKSCGFKRRKMACNQFLPGTRDSAGSTGLTPDIYDVEVLQRQSLATQGDNMSSRNGLIHSYRSYAIYQ